MDQAILVASCQDVDWQALRDWAAQEERIDAALIDDLQSKTH
jgi:hypothetical protein